ncbi:MAG: efflux transporter periplasmic adaptor subunit [Rhodopirellula sp. TMED11]|nr:MAG: efflux transporter periplasmic adaptor subunit [Rhodopirellula sp. TMED11]
MNSPSRFEVDRTGQRDSSVSQFRSVSPVLPSAVSRPAFRFSAIRRSGSMAGAIAAALVVIGITAAVIYGIYTTRNQGLQPGELIVETVSKGAFDHIVLEQGEIESSSNIDVVCKVKSSSVGGSISILWVIDEGARVKEGDKLVELDSSQLEQTLNEDKIRVITAEANVTTAKAAVEQAKIAREEYLEGVYMTEERAILSEKLIAEQELIKSQKALESSQRLAAKGLIKSLQLDADRFALANARNQLAAAEGRLKVLQNLTRRKMLVQFDSDIEAAQAQLAAYESELMEQKSKYADTEEQIGNCIMYAPSDGVVVHANRYSSRGGNAEFVVEAGANVRERQELIRLPDPSKMQVTCKINESRITLISEGMAVKINVDAIPGMVLKGRVSKVNRYAEPSSFFSSSTKEYAVTIAIIDPPETIRTGMTAGVQIFIDQRDNVLQVPITGLYEHGKDMYTLVQEGPEKFRTEKVTIGATNDTMATIEAGLAEGETIVLDLREHLNIMDLPVIELDDNSEYRNIADKDAIKRSAMTNANPDGPSAGGGGRPGGGGGRPGGGGGGRPGGGGPGGGGGGPPSPDKLVGYTMDAVDSNKDGKLSKDEIQTLPSERRGMVENADSDKDGTVTRQELLQAIQSKMGG